MSPNLLWIINSSVLFPENGEEMATKLLQKSKKQVKFLIKIERYAANKPRKEIFNSTTDVFTSFPVIYYKDPPYCLFVCFLSFSVWQRNDGYYLPKWLTAVNNDAAAVFVPLQDWGVRVCSGSPESVCDETCFEVRGDAVGAAACPHLLPLMELSQPICLRRSLRDRMHFKYEICSTLRRWPQLLHDHVWSSSHVMSFSGPQRLLALK